MTTAGFSGWSAAQVPGYIGAVCPHQQPVRQHRCRSRVVAPRGRDTVVAMSERPTPQQVRRALARAERGAALDVAEATVLLAATGADLDRLCRGRRARCATPGWSPPAARAW